MLGLGPKPGSMKRSASYDKLKQHVSASQPLNRNGEIHCRARVLKSGGKPRKTPLGTSSTWPGWALRLKVPDELWGAFNVVTAALRPTTIRAGWRPPQAAREAEALTEAPASVRERLNFSPSLNWSQALACVFATAVVCTTFFVLTAPAAFSVRYAILMALLAAACLTITRAYLLELQWQERLWTEVELADPDSRFGTFGPIQVHYKRHMGPSKATGRGSSEGPLAIHCYHGFGANTFSWAPVDAGMAEDLGALVTSHDMPGFGLTSRPLSPEPYTLQFNGHLGRQIMDAELASEQSDAESATAVPQARRVLMGHSLGAACAVAEAIAHPEGLAALILVAPAVVAFGFGRPLRPPGKPGRLSAPKGGAANVTFTYDPWALEPQGGVLKRWWSTASRVGLAVVQGFAATVTQGVLWLLQPFLVLGLRFIVRSKSFWERGLGQAWYNRSGLTAEAVDGYRRPQLVKGWELGLIRFLRARISENRKGLRERVREAYNGVMPPRQAEKLALTVAEHGLPVLIVHGNNDLLVPVSNSRRLADLLPRSELAVMKKCGHVPHEELPEEFVRLVGDFLAKI